MTNVENIMANKKQSEAKAIISIVASLVVITIVVAAVIYGSTILKHAISNSQANKSLSQPQNQAPADAVAIVNVTFITNPSYPSGYVSLIAAATPYSNCNLSVQYQQGVSGPSLDQKTANGVGQVSWSWIVSKDAEIGSWPVKVSCEVNNTKASSNTNLNIK